ncbi:MAG: OB-fold nucleic acid binding domain-containing protein, partial [Promethearchaeota archaeon]
MEMIGKPGQSSEFLMHPMQIRDIITGIFDAGKKSLLTIFGEIKKVLLVCTILDKEIVYSESGPDDRTARAQLSLDDGTGIVKGVLWDPDRYVVQEIDVGDIVILSGVVTHYRREIQVRVQKIRKIHSFIEELYHRIVILKEKFKLKQDGKPLELENGGTIINEKIESDGTFIFQENEYEGIEAFEEPVKLDLNRISELDFQSSIKEEFDRVDETSFEILTTENEQGADVIDPEVIKDNILSAIIELAGD